MTLKTIVTLLVALLSGSATFAQIHQMEHRDSSSVSRTYNLNPVVVTGSGHHQRLKSTATPVHVISSQEIREQGITTFDDALIRMMPQASMAPNSMGTFLRLNGLGNKYILVLINGQKLSGDI
jgi:outer membrane receptor for ferrienterochelin and colicins